MTDGLRLLDPAALDEKASEPRGRVSIVVPREWLREGARLEVDLPARLRCDLCDGGGCDGCERSGGYKLPDDRAPVAITLPRVLDDHLALRVTNPVADATPSVLRIHVAAGDAPSDGVRFLGPNHDVPPELRGAPIVAPPPTWVRTVVWCVVAAIAALIARCVVH